MENSKLDEKLQTALVMPDESPLRKALESMFLNEDTRLSRHDVSMASALRDVVLRPSHGYKESWLDYIPPALDAIWEDLSLNERLLVFFFLRQKAE